MKTYVSLVGVFSALVASAFAAEGWLNNVEEGVKLAQKDQKIALIEFTGSDWCPPCKKLKKQVFETEEFKKYAAEKFVCVELDFPRKTKLAPDLEKYNEAQLKKFDVTGFPTIIFIDQDGRPFARKVGGPGNATDYIKSLNEMMDKNKIKTTSFQKAKTLSGVEKAKILKQGLDSVDPSLHKFYRAEIDEILAQDANDSLGLKAKYGAEKMLDDQKRELREMREKLRSIVADRPNAETTPASDEVLAKLIAEVDKFLARKELLPIVRQEVLFKEKYPLNYMLNRKMELMIPFLEEIIKIEPTSNYARDAKIILNNINQELQAKEKAKP